MSEILKKTREICQLLEIKPARSKGQNFLINEKIYDEIVKVAEISEDDVVLEVGPGLGFLTARLGEKARQVIAVELDDKIAAYLNMAIAAQEVDNIFIVNEDVLKFNLGAFFEKNGFEARQKYKIVANLPYNISSIFLRTFLSSQLKPESITLMLQKEVANRIIAQAPDNNLLALSVAFYGEAKIIREVKAGNFWPEPKVDSAVIKIDLNQNNNWRDFLVANKIIQASKKKEDLILEQEILNLEKKFFRMLKISFSAKRKMLKNNLVAGLEIKPLELEKSLVLTGIDLKIRAEDLSLEDFKKLFATIYKFMI
ncbi:ribosomal RNA small subunit methyltransferase A [Candidatus Falkowbacteria bacterium]|nr:ribosomal RNA small subunit methyltransferase A [Candidatus Falkowbacteria bacterium]NCT54977.1 ribosomal RNA small subunit methyltransferase A [Candidatus Falkowbacteria bacterium]